MEQPRKNYFVLGSQQRHVLPRNTDQTATDDGPNFGPFGDSTTVTAQVLPIFPVALIASFVMATTST